MFMFHGHQISHLCRPAQLIKRGVAACFNNLRDGAVKINETVLSGLLTDRDGPHPHRDEIGGKSLKIALDGKTEINLHLLRGLPDSDGIGQTIRQTRPMAGIDHADKSLTKFSRFLKPLFPADSLRLSALTSGSPS